MACALTYIISLATFAGLSIVPTNAVDACAGYDPFSNPGFEAETPDWKVLNGPKMIFQVTWTFTDKNKCIIGPSSTRGPRLIKDGTTFPETSWQLGRTSDGFTLVRATFEVPMSWFEFSNFNRTGGEAIKFQFVDIKHNGRPLADYGYGLTALRGTFYWDDLWAIYFAKKQGIYSENCDVIKSEKPYGATVKYLPDFKYRVESPGKSPILNVDIADIRQCIHLVGVSPVIKDEYDRGLFSDFPLMFDIDRYYAHYSFWDSMSHNYAPLFNNNQIPKLRIAQGDFARTTSVPRTLESDPELHEILFPIAEINHTDTVARDSKRVTISSKLDLSAIDISKVTPDSITGVYVGYYYPYSGTNSCSPSRVTVTGSGPTTKLNYNESSCSSPAQKYQYQTKYIQIPTLDLLYGVGKAESERKLLLEAKAATELKAKQEAEVKAAAELKAKQEAEVKAKQEAEAKVLAESRAKQAAMASQQSKFCDEHNTAVKNLTQRVEDLKTNYPDKFSEFFKRSFPGFSLVVASQKLLYSREEPDCESFGRISVQNDASYFKLRKEMWDSQLTSDLIYLSSIETEVRKARNSTITCVKGKQTKKVTAVKPVCPKGYKKK